MGGQNARNSAHSGPPCGPRPTAAAGSAQELEAGRPQHRRAAGGDFLSAGGNRGFLWVKYLYKTYSKELIHSMDPFDSRKDEYFSGIKLGQKGSFRLKF